MAFSKVCPICKQQSFSAGADSNWICPHCGENLTNVPVIKTFDKFFINEKKDTDLKSMKNQ